MALIFPIVYSYWRTDFAFFFSRLRFIYSYCWTGNKNRQQSNAGFLCWSRIYDCVMECLSLLYFLSFFFFFKYSLFSLFSVSFVLSYFFQENWKAFRTISFTPLKLLSPYILFCFTFLIIYQNKEYLREKIKNTKS